MTAAHTPGPIYAEGRHLFNRNGNQFAEVFYATTDGTDENATAARIVACVNACEGMTDPVTAIQSYKKIVQSNNKKFAECAALRAERDKAVAGEATATECYLQVCKERDALQAKLDEYVRVVQEAGCTDEWRKSRLARMAERDSAALAGGGK